MKSNPSLRLCGLLLAALCLLTSGCATIVKGTHQDIPISSEPSGASVLIDGVREGSTPTNVRLSRKQSHVITLEMAGYETENVTLKPSMGGAVAGNIIAGGLIGWGVDASTGAQYNLHPDSVSARLRTKEVPLRVPPTPAPSEVSNLLAELQKLDAMKSEGKISAEEYTSLRAATLKKYQTL